MWRRKEKIYIFEKLFFLFYFTYKINIFFFTWFLLDFGSLMLAKTDVFSKDCSLPYVLRPRYNRLEKRIYKKKVTSYEWIYFKNAAKQNILSRLCWFQLIDFEALLKLNFEIGFSLSLVRRFTPVTLFMKYCNFTNNKFSFFSLNRPQWGRFSHRVAMSVCLSVCLFVCLWQLKTPLAEVLETFGWRAYR